MEGEGVALNVMNDVYALMMEKSQKNLHPGLQNPKDGV